MSDTLKSAESPPKKVIEYAVDYDAIDPVKKLFQRLGAETDLPYKSLSKWPESMGESVQIIQMGDIYFGGLVEGLGTRGLVADAIYESTGASHYRSIGISAAATIFNDFATSGLTPVLAHMYLSAGSNDVFRDMRKMEGLGQGWQHACKYEETWWCGGETPMLRDLVHPYAFEIAGSVFGIISYVRRPISHKDINIGDRIIGIASSGIHDNGLTLVRDIQADRLGLEGYQTELSSGETFGEALMQPTVLYGPLVRDLREEGIIIASAINITGHGLAKIARSKTPFHYELNELPEPQPVFKFIQEQSGLDLATMYSKFNMGVGFVLIVPQPHVDKAVARITHLGQTCWDLGEVKEATDGHKRVILPNGVVFTEKDVDVRA